MKKKILLTVLLVLTFVFAFVLVSSAATPNMYIKFKVLLTDGTEYIDAYTVNNNNGDPTLSLKNSIYSDVDFTQEIDKAQIKGLDFSGAEVVNSASKVVEVFASEQGKPLVNCEEIKWFTAEGSATSIGTITFQNWTSLKSFEFGTVTTIVDRAFNGCAFETLVIPATVQTIKGGAFSGNKKLTSLKFEGDVGSMASGAFSDCTALTSVDLGPLTYVGSKMFGSCTSLTSITIPSTVTEIRTEAFYGCSALESVSLPEGLLTIGETAFCNTALTSVEIPSTVTTIGKSAFNGCTGLASITFAENSQLVTISEKAFFKIGSASIVLPDSVQTVGKTLFMSQKLLVLYSLRI